MTFLFVTLTNELEFNYMKNKYFKIIRVNWNGDEEHKNNWLRSLKKNISLQYLFSLNIHNTLIIQPSRL